jgi:hypothetical protein
MHDYPNELMPNLKRHSMITPITIKLFNSSSNKETANNSNSQTFSKNLSVSNVNLNQNGLNIPSPTKNININLTKTSTSPSSNNLTVNQVYSSSPRPNESRFSLSIDKFGQNQLFNLLEVKRKSQSDLLAIKTAGLSASMFNMSRSCSLNSNELDCLDLKKINIVSKSQLNGLFEILIINLTNHDILLINF